MALSLIYCANRLERFRDFIIRFKLKTMSLNYLRNCVFCKLRNRSKVNKTIIHRSDFTDFIR